MQFLDKTGVGTLWSMCKTKFALKDHSHNYLPLSGGTLTGDLLFSNSGTTFRQIRGTCGDNDLWRIGGGATGNNAGYMEIATADDGNEPIYVRQYSGTFSSVNRTLTLLDANGYTHFPSYISIGGNENNNSSPDRVWGSNGSDSYLRSYRTSALSVANADTVDGVHANQLCRIYTFNVHDSIIKVGTLTSGQSGHVCKLRFNSGIGYNAINTDKTMTVVIRASNGGANSNGFYFESHSESYRGGAFTTFYLHQTSKTQCELYMAAFSQSGQSTYEVSFSDGDSWANEISVQNALPTSNILTLPNYQIAYTNDIPTKLSQLTNDKGFVTGSVSGNTVTINGASTTWTNTWRGIQDNLTSSSTSDSLSANQGRILKGLIDSKANSNEVIKSVSVELYGDTHNGFTPTIVVKDNADQKQAFTIDKANGGINGLMSIKDKKKLDGIDDRANNYTLPVATETTLGGIKVNFIPKNGNYQFKVQRDVDGNANTFIPGLKYGDDECLGGVQVAGDSYTSVTYTGNGVTFNDQNGQKMGDIKFRGTNGYLALTSDIPDVSNLCRFNFVNSISECRSDRINFLLRCPDLLIDLDPLDSYPDGTILLITINGNSANIRHRSGRWYSDGDNVSANYTCNAYKEEINLITKNNGTVYHYAFN